MKIRENNNLDMCHAFVLNKFTYSRIAIFFIFITLKVSVNNGIVVSYDIWVFKTKPIQSKTVKEIETAKNRIWFGCVWVIF